MSSPIETMPNADHRPKLNFFDFKLTEWLVARHCNAQKALKSCRRCEISELEEVPEQRRGSP
jgi:hypothetical protein